MSGIGKLPRVVYIAGYSRSGSTLLDILLGSAPGCLSAGELTFLFDDVTAGRVCTCGRPFDNCPIWARVVDGIDPSRAETLTRRRESGVPSPDPQYDALWRDVFRRLATTTGSTVVVDSSKTARGARARPFALADAGFDVTVVHIHRSARRTIRSYRRRGSNWAAEGRIDQPRLQTARALVGWVRANRAAASATSSISGAQLAHDELVSDPIGALGRLGEFLDLDLTIAAGSVRTGVGISPGHNVGGNRLRLEEKVLLSRRAAGPPLGAIDQLFNRLANIGPDREARARPTQGR